MVRKTSEKIKVAVFVITGAILLIAGIYMIGNKQTMFSNSFTLYTVYRNVNGLQIGNNVRYSGINVGTVGKIDMVNDSTILVTMRVQEKIREHIRKDAVATISSDGLVGSMFVNVIPGNGNTIIISSGDTIQSYTKIGADAMLNTLNVTNENAALLTADLLKITESINDGKGALGVLLNDSTIAVNLKATITNLKITSGQTIVTMQKLNKTIDDYSQKNSIASLLFKDSLQAEELKTIIHNLAVASEGVTATINNLNGVLNDIKQGEGAISTMMYDSVFAIDLKESMHNVNTTTVLLNENLEALKHSFPVKGYFKKEAKRQAKEEKKANNN
jgi:phospholipid/cholesterol/gamma-HCH transport system substrate-binding protein